LADGGGATALSGRGDERMEKNGRWLDVLGELICKWFRGGPMEAHTHTHSWRAVGGHRGK